MGSSKLTTEIEIVAVESVLAPAEIQIRDLVPRGSTNYARPMSATYEYGEVRNGHGRCAEAGITVQIGTSGEIEVDFEVNAISEETFTRWKSEARQFFSSDAWSYLDERHSGSARAGGFFGGIFGYASARGNYQHYRNKRDTFRSTGTQENEGFLRSVHNLDNNTLRIKGRLRAHGVSYIPVTVTAFINVTVITFADGKTLRAVDRQNPVAADPNTLSTSGAASEPTVLTEVPLG